jgi:hypothetical protein
MNKFGFLCVMFMIAGLFMISANAKLDNETMDMILERNSTRCDICEYLITQVQDYLKNPDLELRIEQDIVKVCSIFGDQSLKCETYVDLLFPQFVQVIENKTPVEICGFLKICEPKYCYICEYLI